MFLLVLRLVAVYAGTAALFLFLAHRFVRTVRLPAALFLACAPALFTGKALLTGGVQAPIGITYEAPPLAAHRAEMGIPRTRSPILWDVVASYIPWRKAVRDALERGELPLWNPYHSAGEPLLAMQEPAAFHPATWIGLLLPLPQAWTFEMALRWFLALAAAYLFFRELRCGDLASLLGAAAWAFSSYLIFYLGFPLSPATAPFPLLLLGLRRLARGTEEHGVAITVAALLLIATAGHPETLFHAVVAAGVYFLFELGFAGRGNRLRAILLSLLAGAIAIGLSAMLLLPFNEVLPHTREEALRSDWFADIPKSVPLRQSLRLTVQNAMPYAFGMSGRGALMHGFGEPAGYAGSLIFPLALVGLFSKRRERWPLLLLGLLGLCLWARVPLITDAISNLPLFEIALNQRLAFLVAFALAGLAALGAERIGERRGSFTFLVAAAATTVVLTLLYFHYRPRLLRLEMPSDYMLGRFLLQTVPLGIAALAVSLLAKRGRATATLAILLVVFLAQRRFEAGMVYPTHPSRAFYPPLEILEKIPRHQPYRVVAVDFSFFPNMASLYGLEDVRGYASLTLAPLAETFPFWCIPLPSSFNRVADPTKPFLSFLNVRYVIAPPGYPVPPGWPVLADSEEGVLLENPCALERVFVPQYLFYETQPWTQLEMVKKNPDYAIYGVVGWEGDKALFAKNGEAQVQIVSYSPQKMSLSIDAWGRALIATSIPRWPGWELTLDGREAPLVPYNWAFWAFHVPAGRHEAVLAYRPKGFTIGLRVSAMTLLVCLVLPLLRRSRRAQAARLASGSSFAQEPPAMALTNDDRERAGTELR